MDNAARFRPWNLLPSLFDSTECVYWYSQLNNHLIWERPLLRVYGSSYKSPRLTTFLGEENISYKYSGHTHLAKGWPDWFVPLLEMVASSCDVKFNGCLLNLYRNGMDRMGWHSDDELEIDDTKPIASLSFGATRDFLLKHRYENLRESLPLKSGDLLIMYPPCQNDWQHSVPIRKRVVESRINLTFRCYR